MTQDHTGTARVSELQAVGYRFPSYKNTGVSFNILVIVRITDSQGTNARGFGEGELRNTLRPRGVRHGVWVTEVWEALTDALGSIKDCVIDVSTPNLAVASIESIMAQVRASVTDPLENPDHVRLPNTCMAAIETAFLDAAARAFGLSFSEIVNVGDASPIPTVLYPWTYRPALAEYRRSQRTPWEDMYQAVRRSKRNARRRLRNLRVRSTPQTETPAFDTEGRELPVQDIPEARLAEIVRLPAVRMADTSGPLETVALLSRNQGPQILATEVSPTPITRQVALHLLGAVHGECFLVATPFEDAETFVPAPGPGLGVQPNWDQVFGSKTQLYFTTGTLQADFETPVNQYDLAGMKVLGSRGPQEQPMTQEVLSRGMGVARYSQGSFLAIDQEGTEYPFHLSRTQLSGVPSSALCNHKEVTRMLLSRRGVPTPRGRTFVRGDHDTAIIYAEQIGFPVVVKPAMGFRGIGVFAGLQNAQELQDAFVALEASELGHQDFIVEEHIPGEEYRILVVGNTAVGAIKRVPASVVADGVHSVAELIGRKNALRRLNPGLMFRPITLGWDAHAELERQAIKINQVPPKGTVVTLASTSNLSQGGDSVDILDDFHPSILNAAVKAVDAIPSLGFAGVDFQLEDHRKSLSEQRAAVLEMNAHASLSGVIFPMYGKARPVPKFFIDRLIEVGGMKADSHSSDVISVQIHVKGLLKGNRYWEWIREQAVQNDISGWIRSTGERSATIVAMGPAAQVATLSIAAVRGPGKTSPTSAHTEHIYPVQATGFEVVTSDPEEVRIV